MKVLVALGGREHSPFFKRSSPSVVWPRPMRCCWHMWSMSEPRSGLEGGRERFMVHRSLGASRGARQIEGAEVEAAAGVVLQAALTPRWFRVASRRSGCALIRTAGKAERIAPAPRRG